MPLRSCYYFWTILISLISTTAVHGSTPTPVAPSNLTATAAAYNRINLSWQDNSNNETGFVINRTQNPAVAWNYVATVGANVTSYSNPGLFASTTYYYRVSAINSAGSSVWSNTASATTPPQSAPTPTPANRTVKFAWQASSSPAVVGYKIFWGTGSHNYQSVRDVSYARTASLTLSQSTRYYVTVVAYSMTQTSGFSNEVVVPSAP
jgi:hypothetical protein